MSAPASDVSRSGFRVDQRRTRPGFNGLACLEPDLPFQKQSEHATATCSQPSAPVVQHLLGSVIRVISVQGIALSFESSQIRWNHNPLKSLNPFSVRF